MFNFYLQIPYIVLAKKNPVELAWCVLFKKYEKFYCLGV